MISLMPGSYAGTLVTVTPYDRKHPAPYVAECKVCGAAYTIDLYGAETSTPFVWCECGRALTARRARAGRPVVAS